MGTDSIDSAENTWRHGRDWAERSGGSSLLAQQAERLGPQGTDTRDAPLVPAAAVVQAHVVQGPVEGVLLGASPDEPPASAPTFRGEAKELAE